MKSRILLWVKYLVGWPLTITAFFFLLNSIRDKYPTIAPNIQNSNYSHLAVGFILLVSYYFIRSYIWWRIINHVHKTISYKDSSYLWAISEVKRYIPGNIWSFISRAVLFKKEGISSKEITKGLVYEAQLFILGCLIVSLLALPLLGIGHYTQILFVILVFGIVFYLYHKNIFKFFPQLPKKLSSLFLHMQPEQLLLLVLVSAVGVFLFGLGNYFIMTSFFVTDIQLVWQFVGIYALAFLAGYMSLITPAGFGVRESVVVMTLLRFTELSVASYIALLTRFVLIIAEICFIGMTYFWKRIHSEWIKKIEKMIMTYPYHMLLTIACLVYTFYFTTASFYRYENYYTGRFDLGNMVQTVWNTVHGNIFLLTNPDGTERVSRLAFHADFILVLLAPLYAIWQDPKMLLLIQTVVLAVGAFFVYYLTKHVLHTKPFALVMAIAYLLNPSIQRTNLFDFHPVTLATTFLLGAFYFFVKKRYLLFFLFAFLAALCKEQLWLIVGLFGIPIIFYHKKRLIGSLFLLCCVGMFYYLFWHAIPSSRGSQHFALAYLSEYGDSPTQVLKTFILSPDKLLYTLSDSDRVHFVKQLFSPLGYLSLLFPFILVFALPDLLINLLSNNTQLHQIYYQYTATITPFLFISAIYGVWVIKKIIPQFPLVIIAFYILHSSVQTTFTFGPLPGSKGPDTNMFTRPLADKEYIDSYLASLPKSDAIASTNNIGSHLSQRNEIFTIPLGIGKADTVIFLLDELGSAKTRREERQLVEKMKQNTQYILQKERGNFFVFTKRN